MLVSTRSRAFRGPFRAPSSVEGRARSPLLLKEKRLIIMCARGCASTSPRSLRVARASAGRETRHTPRFVRCSPRSREKREPKLPAADFIFENDINNYSNNNDIARSFFL